MESISENQKTQDHVIEGDGIELDDHNTLQVFRIDNHNYTKKTKEIVAVYSLDHVICACEMS